MTTDPHPHHHAASPAPASPEKLIDPVCGMRVDAASPRGGFFEHAGTTYGFCNPKCRERFAADPARYLAPAPPVVAPPSPATAAPAGPSATTAYLCPMDPEVRADRPGPCPR